jgi:hypothetical protein
VDSLWDKLHFCQSHRAGNDWLQNAERRTFDNPIKNVEEKKGIISKCNFFFVNVCSFQILRKTDVLRSCEKLDLYVLSSNFHAAYLKYIKSTFF